MLLEISRREREKYLNKIRLNEMYLPSVQWVVNNTTGTGYRESAVYTGSPTNGVRSQLNSAYQQPSVTSVLTKESSACGGIDKFQERGCRTLVESTVHRQDTGAQRSPPCRGRTATFLGSRKLPWHMEIYVAAYADAFYENWRTMRLNVSSVIEIRVERIRGCGETVVLKIDNSFPRTVLEQLIAVPVTDGAFHYETYPQRGFILSRYRQR